MLAAAPRPFVVGLDEIGREDQPLVGSKAAHLGELVRLQLEVPPGFCVTSAALSHHLEGSGLAAELDPALLWPAGGNGNGTGARIRELFLARALVPEVAEQILAAYRALSSRSGCRAVAVRSSALAEDLADSSFAGVYETFLDVEGAEELLWRLRCCWASFFSESAFLYRQARGAGELPVGGGVLVQAMLRPRVAGVVFTANPLSGDRTELVIEATPGLGDKLVAGEVTPQRYVVGKAPLRIVHKAIPEEPPAGAAQALPDRDVLRLAERALEVERRYRQPQDLEWAAAGGELFFVQTRPITTSGAAPAAGRVDGEIWMRAKIQERFPDPLKPVEGTFLAEWIFAPGFERLFRGLGMPGELGREVFRVFDGTPHLNKALLIRTLRGVPEPVAREIIESENGEVPSLAGIPFSFPLLVNLLRWARIAVTRHRELERDVAKFRRAYEPFHRRDFSRLSLPELGSELEAMGTMIRAMSTGHMQSILLAEMLFGALHELLRASGEERPAELLPLVTRGMAANKSVELAERFNELVAAARSSPAVRQILTAREPGDAASALHRDPACTPFLRRLADFLEDFGHRSAKYALTHPRWRESPAEVLALVAGYLRSDIQPEKVDYEGEEERRRAVVREIRGRLRRGGWLQRLLPAKALAFTVLAHYARIYCGLLRENEGFYITRSFPDLKRLLRAIGEELARRGTLAEWEDVHFLTLSEIRASIRRPRGGGLREQVVQRRLDYALAVSSRSTAGTAGECPADAFELTGIPVSPGTAAGRACVVTDPGQPLGKDAILVTHTLNASWVPLLRGAAGLVTEVGGLLSHGAVVAREFGVPAVMGVADACRRIPAGRHLALDGTNGWIIVNHDTGNQEHERE